MPEGIAIKCLFHVPYISKLYETLHYYYMYFQAHLFTFLTYNKHSSQMLPGRLACYNQGAMAKVTENTEVFRQMAPYFRFLEASSGARDPIWTSPYLDKAGLGLMVTYAVPVYSNITNR